MAKRKRFTRTRRAYARGRGIVGRMGGKFSGIIPPILGGAADTFLTGYNLPIIGKLPTGVGSTLVGHFMHSQTTRDIGLYQIGASLPGMLGVGGGSGGLGHPVQGS